MSPQAPAAIDRDNPWPGLASYEEAAHAFFAGRNAEIAELTRRIVDEPLTVLFGKSGLGKSSLLKAGAFPELRRRGLLPVPVRLLFGADAPDALEQLAKALFEVFGSERIEHPQPASGEPLWDYLHRAELRFWTPKVRPVQPVFVLDQFEEVFTLGRRAGTGDMLRDRLADLAENRIPARLAERAERGEALALDMHVQPYKIVLSLREDFLPELEGWIPAMPSLLRNRMRLAPLQRREALQAVHNEHTAHLVDAALAARIVDYLAGAADGDVASVVEPALLSLVCRGINEARKRAGKPRFDDTLFEVEKSRIVADFYRESLADQTPRVARFIEDELVTEQGFRNSYSVLDAVERGLVRRDEIATLVDRRLLRLEHHLGAERVELTHDLLTRAALEGHSRRVARERKRHVVVTSIVAFTLFVGIAFVALDQYQLRVQAQTAEHQARSRELAAASRSALSRDAQLAVALAAEGLSASETTEARNGLLSALGVTWPAADLGEAAIGGEGHALAVEPAGKRLAVVSKGGLLSLWEIEQRMPRLLWQQAIERPDGGEPTGLVFAADGASVYVADSRSVQRFEVASANGSPREAMTLPANLAGHTTQLAVSGDGQWLAALVDGRPLLRPLGSPGAEWELVEPEGFKGVKWEIVALSDDGDRLIGVIDRPLRALQLEREGGGRWKATQLDNGDNCRELQSISSAPHYVASTWSAGACIVSLDDPSKPWPLAQDKAISDSIASSLGSAYAAIMSNRDLQVGIGVPDGEGSVLRGAGGEAPRNMSGLVALDEQASRVAVLKAEGGVRVFYVGNERLLLGGQGKIAITSDGRWLAQALGVAAEPGATAELQIYAIEEAFGSVELPRVRHRVALPSPVRKLHATRSRLLLTLAADEDGGSWTLTVDAASGVPAGPASAGEVNDLGSAAELLVVPAGSDTQGRPLATIVRRSDDKTLAPWASGTAAALVDVSGDGLAVLVRYPGDAGSLRADTYIVRGAQLRRVGQISGLPDKKDGRFSVADDGRSIRERRLVSLTPGDPNDPQRPSVQNLNWVLHEDRVVDARIAEAAARPQPAPRADGDGPKVLLRSPNGTFEVVTQGGRPPSLTRAGTPEPLLKLPKGAWNFAFSDDERLLAYASEDDRGEAVDVYDLQNRRPWLRLRLKAVDRLTFYAGSRLLWTGSQLVPLDTRLLMRFARWHVLTPLPDESCERYRLEGTEWCNRAAVTGAAASPVAR